MFIGKANNLYQSHNESGNLPHSELNKKLPELHENRRLKNLAVRIYIYTWSKGIIRKLEADLNGPNICYVLDCARNGRLKLTCVYYVLAR